MSEPAISEKGTQVEGRVSFSGQRSEGRSMISIVEENEEEAIEEIKRKKEW